MEQAGELGSLAEALSLRLVIIFRLQRTGGSSALAAFSPATRSPIASNIEGGTLFPASAALAEAIEMEAERSVMRSYPTGSCNREMSGNDHGRAIGEGLKEAPPCRSRHFRVNAEAAVELRLGALQRSVHNMATQDHGCSLRAHHDADAAGCMPRPRLDPYTVVEGVVRGSAWPLSMTGSGLSS
jgi:hypothetical protein